MKFSELKVIKATIATKDGEITIYDAEVDLPVEVLTSKDETDNLGSNVYSEKNEDNIRTGELIFESKVLPKFNNDVKLNSFITSISFILPNDYAEALKGDLFEKRNKMLKHKQPRWYIWAVIIVNIGYTLWAAVWFKLKDVMDIDDVKEIDK